jgi:hypothetical protein
VGWVNDVGRVGQVAVVQEEADVFFVGVVIEVIDPRGVEGGRAPLHAVDPVSLAQEKLGQIGAVLTRNPGYESRLLHTEPS